MSGPGEDRWRGGRPFDNRQPTQRNATLGSRDRAAGSRGAQNANQSSAWSGPREQNAPGLSQERHVSVKSFNAAECKAALKPAPSRAFSLPTFQSPVFRPEMMASVTDIDNRQLEPAPLKYKPTGPSGKDTASNRASAPWATKPNSMANNKDFFLELRKQVTILRQGGSIPGG
ncbi:uncharacterized protein TRUGW13939_00103 [Talaromyces rugulosus]|uniref:Uncharacterized protein n=1 Tax=Talaromyces rugulosus TaxID=121627 RepID=A0A7H8QHI9_TALRU|nr:uncharacterized protein TRUGW13939_00103 [Talaromyces rugulosus]QKX53032.1 hypothetical protein TRUGW13939_00103 [Talaromyces rugulosus]